MNPLTNVKNLNKVNERELALGYTNSVNSWHNQYSDSAWVFVGGLDYDLTEGDIVCIFSQYGEIVNVNLVRDPKTGKSRGYGFICYEDQRSTILAVDNFNGAKVLGRIMRVDHVLEYKLPKELQPPDLKKKISKFKKPQRPVIVNDDIVLNTLREKGCAPEVMQDLKIVEASVKKK